MCRSESRAGSISPSMELLFHKEVSDEYNVVIRRAGALVSGISCDDRLPEQEVCRRDRLYFINCKKSTRRDLFCGCRQADFLFLFPSCLFQIVVQCKLGNPQKFTDFLA